MAARWCIKSRSEVISTCSLAEKLTWTMERTRERGREEKKTEERLRAREEKGEKREVRGVREREKERGSSLPRLDIQYKSHLFHVVHNLRHRTAHTPITGPERGRLETGLQPLSRFGRPWSERGELRRGPRVSPRSSRSQRRGPRAPVL